MEYLAYGRPLLVTDRTETAAIVRRADAGIVMGDDPSAMADAIRRLFDASEARRRGWAAGATAAARANGWEQRARQVLEAFGLR
jgi:glycosyltransferase involved in cell wall biosynthesis